MSNFAKGKGKRIHHKQDVNRLNRTALIIGGAAAGGLLLIMVFSFLTT